jgi:hypothetical protein
VNDPARETKSNQIKPNQTVAEVVSGQWPVASGQWFVAKEAGGHQPGQTESKPVKPEKDD